MTAVAIAFSPDGGAPVFDFTGTATGFNTTIQNALVTLGTRIGSDQIFTDRGTSLLEDANQGGFTDINTANTAASFAANDVLIFNQLNDNSNNVYRLTSFTLTAVSISNQNLFISITAGDANGDTAGVTTAM